jgi:large subunit ribosomal protein L9
MKVILHKEVPNLGTIGDIVKVKDGYARNFLIPKGFAALATDKNLKQLEHQKLLVSHKEKKFMEESKRLVEKIERVSCTIARRVGEESKLFGSVTSADISASLASEGVEVDKRTIELDEPIKQLGVFTVPVKVHREIKANLKVWVVKEEEA